MSIKPISGQAPDGYAEIHGVEAGSFDPSLWEKGNPHILPDYRHPFLSPQFKGVFRNIYAPSVVRLDDGKFRIYYGAWDGIDKGNDKIYSIDTADFLDFTNRHQVIDNNIFTHVCNVNCTRLPNGEFRMMCTAYPDVNGQNKPIVFTSPDGEVWNGSRAPYSARMEDLVRIEGYSDFAQADINGMNVIFYEDGNFFIYFNDFKRPWKVFRARSSDGKTFTYEGVVLEVAGMVNDVKRFEVMGKPWYLMGLHCNKEALYYSLSSDPMKFPDAKTLATNLDGQDKFIVAIGWVVNRGRLLGYLYGAGAHKSLDRNCIFARWLQKKVVFVGDDGKRYEATRSLGPDRQLIAVPSHLIDGHFEVFAEDGTSKLMEGRPARLQDRGVYVVQARDPR